jgi:hypothetical protein
MQALESRLNGRLATVRLPSNRVGTVKLLASADFQGLHSTGSGPMLGLYVHRVTVDPEARNAFRPAAPGSNQQPRPLLPLNLHFLLVASAPKGGAADEIQLLAWGMRELSALSALSMPELTDYDEEWTESETVQILPEELPTEDLLKIWDALPCKYSLTATFVVRTIRVLLDTPPTAGPVIKRVLEMGGP